MEEQDNQQAPKDLDKPKPKMSLSKLYLWIGSLLAMTAAIFGTLADGKSVFSGCNSSDIPHQIEKVDVSKLKFKKYQGRYGCSFLYPADWDVAEDELATLSMGREILHPINPEICILLSAIPYPAEVGSIQELGGLEERWLQENNGKMISQVYYRKSYSTCDRDIVLGKITFSTRSNKDESIKKIGVKTYTQLGNGVLYALSTECPERDYEAYKELIRYIIQSIEFDCNQLDNEF